METTKKMLESISKLYEQEKKVEEKKREEGEFFNVFNTIGLRTEEVRLHSAFIAELLNPKGSHGLSHCFLQAFLEMLQQTMGAEQGQPVFKKGGKLVRRVR